MYSGAYAAVPILFALGWTSYVKLCGINIPAPMGFATLVNQHDVSTVGKLLPGGAQDDPHSARR